MKKIKFLVVDDWNDLLEDIMRVTRKMPKHFKSIYVGTTDYVVAYCDEKFTSREAVSLWNKHND